MVADPVLYQTIYEDIQRRVAQLAERLRECGGEKCGCKIGRRSCRGSREINAAG